ncbi:MULTISPECIES: hypothetical protein [unclassified Salinivibrio]|uniref:hypothetical protein n=1 Tax=unclassified Salinivibrio TaxID=2636825 RepID=UPI00098436CD|nr:MULTISPECIES: hypothetical protein [unclassified Salinivibrio]OOF08222.1 hypothetical protein BZG83_16275 [Salinivibrio sp. PR919]OOF16383.1 hypothetical protein BZG84_10335 [Salinivibrio sp. PR932]
MKNNNSNTFFNILAGALVGAVAVSSLYLAAFKPYLAAQHNVEQNFYSGYGIDSEMQLPSDLSTTQKKVQTYLYMVHQSRQSDSSFNLDPSCLQGLVSASEDTFVAGDKFMDTYFNYGKQGNPEDHPSDIQRRINLLTGKTVGDQIIERNGFFESKVAFLVLERSATDVFEKYSVKQFQTAVDECVVK